jgi:hypothetical protein
MDVHVRENFLLMFSPLKNKLDLFAITFCFLPDLALQLQII